MSSKQPQIFSQKKGCRSSITNFRSDFKKQVTVKVSEAMIANEIFDIINLTLLIKFGCNEETIDIKQPTNNTSFATTTRIGDNEYTIK